MRIAIPLILPLLAGLLAGAQEKEPKLQIRNEGKRIVARRGGQELWILRSPSTFSHVKIVNLGTRVGKAVLAGTGSDGTDLGVLYCVDRETGIQKWKFQLGAKHYWPDERLRVTDFAIGDLDDDLLPDIAVTASHEEYFPGRLCVLDAEGKLLTEFWNPGHISGVTIVNVEASVGKAVIITGTNNDENASFAACFKGGEINGGAAIGEKNTALWYYLHPEEEPVNLAFDEAVDVDNNGVLDLRFKVPGGEFHLDLEGYPVGPEGRIRPSLGPETISDTIYADIQQRHFPDAAADPAWKEKVKLIRMDPSWVDHVSETRYTRTVHLRKYAADKTYVILTDAEGTPHVHCYQDEKHIYGHPIDEVRYRIIERIGAALSEEVDEKTQRMVPKRIDFGKFEKRFSRNIGKDEWRRVRKVLKEAEPERMEELLRGLYMLKSKEEKQAACWLITKMGEMGFKLRSGAVSQDAQILDAQTLYENVYYAHKARRTFPWTMALDESTYYKFVLPHRGTGEPLQRWRKILYEALFPELERMKDAEEVAYLLLCLSADLLQYRQDMTWEDEGIVTMLMTHQGRCEDMTNLTNALFRAAGIPAAHVVTPMWGKGDGNHAWSCAWVGDRTLSFMGCSMPKDRDCFQQYMGQTAAAKVYLRDLFAERDVTKDYTDVADLTFTLDAPGTAVHLAVFNSGGWGTVAQEETDGQGKVAFKDVGCQDILYMVTWEKYTIGHRGEVKPATGPFVLEEATREPRMLLDTETVDVESMASPLDFIIEGQQVGTETKIGQTYRLVGWGAAAWHEVMEAIADGEGKVPFRGEANRLYILMNPGGEALGRPFEVLPGGEVVRR